MKREMKKESWRNDPKEILRRVRTALETPECEDIVEWALNQRYRSRMLTQNSKMISNFIFNTPENKLKAIGKRILKFFDN